MGKSHLHISSKHICTTTQLPWGSQSWSQPISTTLVIPVHVLNAALPGSSENTRSVCLFLTEAQVDSVGQEVRCSKKSTIWSVFKNKTKPVQTWVCGWVRNHYIKLAFTDSSVLKSTKYFSGYHIKNNRPAGRRWSWSWMLAGWHRRSGAIPVSDRQIQGSNSGTFNGLQFDSSTSWWRHWSLITAESESLYLWWAAPKYRRCWASFWRERMMKTNSFLFPSWLKMQGPSCTKQQARSFNEEPWRVPGTLSHLFRWDKAAVLM